jgi:tRNA threonylcarbamoyl adenosine modification protein YeaZ
MPAGSARDTMGERLVLVMDGSTRACSAALLTVQSSAAQGGEAAQHFEAWRVVTRRMDSEGRGQARVLLGWVDEMLRECGAVPGDLAAVVVGTGPGTFTGVRIAVATARALALALAIPVLGVSTLSCLAASAAEGAALRTPAADGEVGRLPDLIVPVVDARRGQVFFGLYEAPVAARIHAPAADVPAVAIDRRGAAAAECFRRNQPFAVCDAGALAPLISSRMPHGSRALIVGEPLSAGEEIAADLVFQPALVTAEHLLVGQSRLEEPTEGVDGRRLGPWLAAAVTEPVRRDSGAAGAGEPGSPETVKPIYVRSPDADIHITKMKDPWAEPSGGR